MISASTVLRHGRCRAYRSRREVASPSPSGIVQGMATTHVRNLPAARAAPGACLQGPPPPQRHFLSVYFFSTFNTSWIIHHKWTPGLCPTH